MPVLAPSDNAAAAAILMQAKGLFRAADSNGNFLVPSESVARVMHSPRFRQAMDG